MKIKNVYRVPAELTPEHFVVREEVVCDFCGEFATNKCCICSSDICTRHIERNYDEGDYPDYYCKSCFDLKHEKYAGEYRRLQDEYNKAIDDLELKIKEESLLLVKESK